ncbi:cytochrome c biogenesis protein ResB [Streptomyces sp. JJ36]|uniref:cytochrome c biogenesis protein ResB n=1 Tax=Streptomyces sp. JJ36 TaxID=2736645 RepID=UPI001F22A6A5|nr:cytochrome c biogenesis protein ResB [Streptomyces sp. JJ36]MCF6524713.1 cytochrome c biogenesis protein ResB [Streptomyces sp. JJ36]
MSEETPSGAAPADRRGGTVTAEAERELGDAMSQLSTAPAEDDGRSAAGRGSFGGARRPGAGGALAWTGRETLGWTRWFWRQLTSMRVALILLFLLSLAAIPGSVIPQSAVDAVQVREFKERHELLAPLYEKLQLFDVYTSVWFSAIYILLFVSLAGCIVPRSWQFVGQLRARPPRAPRRLDRMPAYTTWRTDAPPEEVLRDARTVLGRKRFRVHAEDAAVASEKGYLREAGNLLFHIALIVLLLAFAAGQLFKAEGGKLVIVGDGFSNTLTQYDDFSSGSLFSPADLDAFGFRLDGFDATFEKSGPNKGSVRTAEADVTWWKGAEGTERKSTIRVNHPLEVGNSKVYLLANGYAPVVTVRDGQGDIAYRGPVAFLPQDGNLTSSGVIKVTDYRDAEGKRDQLGFRGFFVPTFGGSGAGTMFSQSPELEYPVLFLTAYHGDLGLDAGIPQNVYQLDTDNMKQFTDEDGGPFAQKILPGESMKLPDGAGTLTFDGVKRWANFQIAHQVGNGWALAGALAAIAGLAGSLFIQRRRVWVRAARDAGGLTVVEMAGLGRSDSPRLPEELGDLAADLQRTADPVDTAGDGGDTGTGDAPGGAGESGPAAGGDPTRAGGTTASGEPDTDTAADTDAAPDAGTATGPEKADAERGAGQLSRGEAE